MISLRNITGYALVKAVAPLSNKISVRNEVLLVAYGKLRTVTRSKIGKLLLLDMINEQTPEVFTTNDLTFDSPVTNAVAGEKNTKVTVTSAVGSSWSGSITFQYNRFNFDQYFPDTAWKLTILAATTVHSLIPAINAAYGCNLVTDDLVDHVVSANATVLKITASSESYMFIPGTTVQLGISLPTLSSIVTVTNLPGFESVTG